MKKSFLSILGLLITSLLATEAMPGIWTNNDFIYKPSLGARGATEKATFDNSLDRVDARLAKEIWVGDPNYGTTLQEAVAAIGSAAVILRASAGNHNFAADFSIPANITLKPERGALLTVADGKTLTLNGGVEAGLYQIFSCTGSGRVVFAAGAVPTIYPQWWGASPSATAMVNAAAIQASFNALTNNSSWTLPPGQYTCNTSIVLGSYATTLESLDLVFKGELLFDTCSGLDIRGVRYSNIRGIDVKRTAQAWSANHFGVKFGKCRRSNIEIKRTQNFTYGFYLDGDSAAGDSNSYLTFHLGYIADNKYGQYVTSANGGWNNECAYYGGQFTQNNKAMVSGDWGIYFQSSPSSRYDNHRWYNPSFEQLHNGLWLAGYGGAHQMLLNHPRFESVDNWIEAAPRALTWIQGAAAISRADMATYCPRLNDTTGKATVTILGSGYYDLDAYAAYATPKENGLTWYSMWDLRQVTNLLCAIRDYFCLNINDVIIDGTGSGRVTTQYLNKGFQGTAAPTTAGNSMSYAKGAVVWNTNIASGQPMGWVCSSSGSIYRSMPVTGIGNVSGTTLTMTTVGNSYYLFPGGFIKINGVQHQIKSNPSSNVYTLYANNLGGDINGATLADNPPTWVAMPNYP